MVQDAIDMLIVFCSIVGLFTAFGVVALMILVAIFAVFDRLDWIDGGDRWWRL
jgi:uncharacterized membrane protein YqjE